MFSQALIEAYQLELNDAIYPRIIVSQNLFEFFKPDVGVNSLEHVLKENDGFWFIDYLGIADKDTAQYQLKNLTMDLTQKIFILRKNITGYIDTGSTRSAKSYLCFSPI